MMQISGSRASSVGAWLMLAGLVLLANARAARVDDVFAQIVPAPNAGPEATRAAFTDALRRVLIKATGLDAAGSDAVVARFGDPATLVQQYRRDGSGNLWAQFDPAAIRRGLVEAGLPVWGEDRPLTAVWLAYDTGSGERDVVAAAGGDGPTAVGLRAELLAAAAARAVPVVLPLRDSQELGVVSSADVWGEFTDPVVKASARYQADATLIGRARLFPAGSAPDVKWTLLAGGERADWRGGIADGPRGLAERLVQRLGSGAVTTAAARLEVTGITSLDGYGEVLSYLQSLDVIESVSVAGLSGATVSFDLALRGERDRLVRALAARRILEPSPPAVSGSDALRYRLASGGP
jgi:hypothetical protein